ncbi:arginyltransferase [Thioalkalivibrio sp. ALE23]|uniref:arginyltransferase n=1 Tax=Thioalkalivibrio sp. ALE23 TaxID=1265495 RepID=UPI00037087FF|nr:arginyltransferase [Thioalkalivibrio sp. ALE23]
MQESPIRWYLTAPQPCPYITDGREMQSLLVDPEARLDAAGFGALLAEGFRRSGRFVYRHHCPACDACVPVRIPVAAFRPNRSQRRCLRANADLDIDYRAPPGAGDGRTEADLDEHMPLFLRYLRNRHAGGGMEQMNREEYAGMLTERSAPVELLEFRRAGQLLGVAITDRTPQGLSAMYTFYEPDLPARALGTFGILCQIEHARNLGLPHVYLGYWIPNAPRMDYKIRFRPAEGRRGGAWRAPDDARPQDPR